jgi:molecular chaperone DnaJ
MVNITMCDRCRGLGRIVETPCPTCNGDGRVERKRTLRVAVPPGIDDGHQIRLSGEGEAAPRGGTPGNLYVVIHVQPHPQLRRQDSELFYDLELSVTQATLGASLMVPTAEGEEQIEVKAGTQPGTEIRLRGRGVPHLRRAGVRGDLHVLVDVRVPSRLTARQRDLLEQLAAEMGEGDAASTEAPSSRRRKRKAPGLRDRLKDAIS